MPNCLQSVGRLESEGLASKRMSYKFVQYMTRCECVYLNAEDPTSLPTLCHPVYKNFGIPDGEKNDSQKREMKIQIGVRRCLTLRVSMKPTPLRESEKQISLLGNLQKTQFR